MKGCHHTLLLVIWMLLTPLISKGHNDKSAQQLMATIDSLEQIMEYDKACYYTSRFMDQYVNQADIDTRLMARAYLKQSLCIRTDGKNRESIPLIEKALELAHAISDSALIANSYRELGFSHTIIGNYQQGLQAFTTALQLDQELNDLVSVSLGLNAIGKINEMWKEFDKALDFFYQSLDISRSIDNLSQVAIRKASIGSVYKSLGKYDKALEYLERSLELEIELDNEVRKGYRLDQIGEVYTLMEEYQKAGDVLFSALKIFRDNRILVSESIVLNHIALNYMRSNQLDKALQYYQESLDIAKDIGFNNMLQKNYNELSELKEKKGQYDKALEYYKQFVALKDSAFNEQAKQELLDFQVRYESEQKEKELALLNQERLEQELRLNQARQQRIFMGAILVVLVISIGALYSRFYIKKRAEQKLAALNRQLNIHNQTKNKFFTILAHDLKNPIYAFRNISTSIHENYSELAREEIHYYTNELKSTSEKLCTFLDDLLKWAASLTGQLTPKTESVKLKPLFDELAELFKPMAESKNIHLKVDVSEDHTVVADRNMANTIFRNILSNAIKFTNKGGWVTIDSMANSHEVSINISDSGIGISQQDIPKLFHISNDPSQIGESKEKGMGFGLFLCKEFADKNHGRIWAESSLGEGSVFHIVLPAKPSDNDK